MNEIYRLRPVIDKTIEELTEPYLWFSRPTEYNDIEDANVIAFSNQNATVKDLFELIFENSEDLGKELSRLGMCCFTKYLPKATEWGRFPKGHNSIFIEYDKKILEEYFCTKYYLGNCFKEVQYKEHPIILESSDENGYDVLWEETENGKFYKSLRGDIARDPKLMDEFIIRFITTIHIRYRRQHEKRIILPYRVIQNAPQDVLGYKIKIPKESIRKIYYNRNTDESFVSTLKEMGFLTVKK
ncbi:hypothetical protein [Bacteroides sp. MSB163]|jgi:hypothetical protein|uniref:hypothetical protein n=1 Tax=Bacteroides maternus TaxID=3117552 RepID=UPI002EDB1619